MSLKIIKLLISNTPYIAYFSPLDMPQNGLYMLLFKFFFYHFTPRKSIKYCDIVFLSLCACITRKPHSQASPRFIKCSTTTDTCKLYNPCLKTFSTHCYAAAISKMTNFNFATCFQLQNNFLHRKLTTLHLSIYLINLWQTHIDTQTLASCTMYHASMK